MRSKGVAMNTGEKIDYMIQCLQVAKAAFVNSDSQLYKQAGNGVTVNVIEAIAEKIRFA